MREFNISYMSGQNTLYSANVKASAYTTVNTDYVILVDSTNTVTITLPTAVGRRGKQFFIKDWSGNANVKNITIATTSSQTIDGAGSKTINAAYGKFLVVSDNSNWFVLSGT